MYVKNVRLYAKHLRYDLATDPAGLPEPALVRFLLQGANGSGKSTILEAIATLWDFFGEWIDVGAGRSMPRRWRCFKHYFADPKVTDLAAVELGGLLPNGQSLWLGMGKAGEWVGLKELHQPTSSSSSSSWLGDVPQAPRQFAGLIQTRQGDWEVQLPPGDWKTVRQRSQVGVESYANVVYIPPEARTVPLVGSGAPHLVDPMPYRWFAAYGDHVELESLLLTFKARSPGDYENAIAIINRALGNQRKEIADIGPNGFIVRGRTEPAEDYEHLVSGLSSGEKQLVLLIGFVAATLQPGGIVIIDEPDLHIHIGMVQQLLGSIDGIVKARGGQLIVAAHSDQVWEWFSRDSEKIQLSAWRGGKL
jgi:energy-coupling factor transporter ATP-binding protein EcfA2